MLASRFRRTWFVFLRPYSMCAPKSRVEDCSGVACCLASALSSARFDQSSARLSTYDHNRTDGYRMPRHLASVILHRSMALQLKPQPSAKPVEDVNGGPIVPLTQNARLSCVKALVQARMIGWGMPRYNPMARSGILGSRLRALTTSATTRPSGFGRRGLLPAGAACSTTSLCVPSRVCCR